MLNHRVVQVGRHLDDHPVHTMVFSSSSSSSQLLLWDGVPVPFDGFSCRSPHWRHWWVPLRLIPSPLFYLPWAAKLKLGTCAASPVALLPAEPAGLLQNTSSRRCHLLGRCLSPAVAGSELTFSPPPARGLRSPLMTSHSPALLCPCAEHWPSLLSLCSCSLGSAGAWPGPAPGAALPCALSRDTTK